MIDILPLLSMAGLVGSALVLIRYGTLHDQIRRLTRERNSWKGLYFETADQLAVHQEREMRRQRGLRRGKA